MELKGSTVLVTGADGFIGSHLTERLVAEGALVTALVQYNSFNSWGWLDGLPILDEITVVTGDIRDPHFCYQLTRNIEVIFHLAALIPIPYSYRAPDSYVDTNIRGTLNLCQGALHNGCFRFIHTSTSEVYGTALYVPVDEEHPLQPQSPYSATKISADAIVTSLHLASQLPSVIARPFNTYGPRQSARAVIPTIISQIAAGSKELALGDLTPTRDFNYVADTCEGFVSIGMLEDGCGEVFNIGSNTEISIAHLARTIADLMGVPIDITCDDQRRRPEQSEVRRLCCDNRKLKRASGFEPKVGLHEGLGRTIRWFEQNLNRYKPDIYNV